MISPLETVTKKPKVPIPSGLRQGWDAEFTGPSRRTASAMSVDVTPLDDDDDDDGDNEEEERGVFGGFSDNEDGDTKERRKMQSENRMKTVDRYRNFAKVDSSAIVVETVS